MKSLSPNTRQRRQQPTEQYRHQDGQWNARQAGSNRRLRTWCRDSVVCCCRQRVLSKLLPNEYVEPRYSNVSEEEYRRNARPEDVAYLNELLSRSNAARSS
jgi:hypothetical protein